MSRALTIVGTVALSAIESQHGLQSTWLAKPAIEVVLAITSYFILRHWVFRMRD